MKITDIKREFKKGKIQIFNDIHDPKPFCKLTDQQNLFNHYYKTDNYSSRPFDLPIIKLSEYKKLKLWN